ncbi:MAG: MOSC domain-containing protein [Chloroflexota bacterium]|nr:MOSC domain-containing protein [Chloroflexota bacterium]
MTTSSTLQPSPIPPTPPDPHHAVAWRTLHIQTGAVETRFDDAGEPWQTAIYKQPVTERIAVTTLGLAGDERTGYDPDRAICCHAEGHYRFWESYFNRVFPLGTFGENITLDGALDELVCVGDIYQCGTAVMQVTQPRTPCYKQAKKIGVPTFVKLIEATRRRGFLLRVLQEGTIMLGESFELLERPFPTASLIYVNRIFLEKNDPERIAWLADLAPLAHDWRAAMQALVTPAHTQP